MMLSYFWTMKIMLIFDSALFEGTARQRSVHLGASALAACSAGWILVEPKLVGKELALARDRIVDRGWWMVDGGSRCGCSDGIGFARGGNCKIKGRRASKLPEQPD
ncbi:hypothetical protein PAL_GLEAN10007906 [Pteropus alecto]|uniref:Uncharacterized protein n=1 Tax=Pteropus alecto TaxID=9402 RepID=L5L6G8_PTEAL|nr:hypothetical protein PAL_GLEAN10007906 [Pteropus alecto]